MATVGGRGGRRDSKQIWGRRIERLLFWTERLGMLVMSLYWVFLLETQVPSSGGWRVARDKTAADVSYSQILSVILNGFSSSKFLSFMMVGFWICNQAYSLVFSGSGRADLELWDKIFPEQKQKTQHQARPAESLIGEEEEDFATTITITTRGVWLERLALFFWYFGVLLCKSPGFWLERIALLYWTFGVLLHGHRLYRPANLILNVCFIIIFPLLNVYFACFGYSKEFQTDLHHHRNGENKTAREEIQPHNAAFSTNPNVRDDGRNQIQKVDCNLLDNEDTRSATNDLQVGRLAILEDKIMSRINSMEENYKRNLVRSQDELKTVLKQVVEEKYEEYKSLREQNNELAIKLSSATTSSQLYRSLLHDNISFSD